MRLPAEQDTANSRRWLSPASQQLKLVISSPAAVQAPEVFATPGGTLGPLAIP